MRWDEKDFTHGFKYIDITIKSKRTSYCEAELRYTSKSKEKEFISLITKCQTKTLKTKCGPFAPQNATKII